MNLQDVEVMQKGIEVWFATKQLILDAHYALCSMPVRSRIAVTNLPIDPLIKKTLRGLNYLCLQDTTKDKSEKRHMRGMISVQEFDGVEKMLAILALTR